MSGAPVAASDLARFRRLCGQFRRLAIFMVVSVGSVYALKYLVAPLAISARSDRALVPQEMMASLIWIIPAALIFLVVAIGGYVVTVICWFAILFTGTQPRGMFDFLLKVYRYSTRFNAYIGLLTDTYPKFE